MSIKSLMGAAALGLLTATQGQAAPIDLDFTFSVLSGTFHGLDDADGVSSASFVTVDGGIDSYFFDTADAVSNSFTFSAGSLTDMAFSYTDPVIGTGASGVLTNFDCVFDNCTSSEQTIPFGAFINVPGAVPVFAIRPAVGTVPLPAGGVLLISGLIALASLRSRRRR